MPTKQQLIDDVILRITKGAPSDDLEISPRQIAFWFDITAAEVVPKYVDSKLRKLEPLNPLLIEIDDNLEPEVEDVTMLDQYTDRVYIETTKSVMDLAGDRGVLRVINEEGQKVDRVPIEHLDTLNSMRFSKPSPDNLLFSRINQRLYLHGLSPKSVDIVTFSVTYIPKINISDLDLTDTVKLPDEVIGLISDAIEEKARNQMHGLPDIENDAEDDNQSGQ